jgi:hypothetical protein
LSDFLSLQHDLLLSVVVVCSVVVCSVVFFFPIEVVVAATLNAISATNAMATVVNFFLIVLLF